MIERKRLTFKSTAVWVLKTILTLAALLVFLYPIYIVICSALKTKNELAKNPFGLPKTVTFENFKAAFQRMNYTTSLLNTLTISIITVGILIIIGSMASYAISRRGKKYNKFYFLFLAGMMIPFQMTMIPLYQLLKTLSLIDTKVGVILVYLSRLAPFTIFLMTGFIRTVPTEMDEAACLDGAGLYRTFFQIIFPLLKPPIATVVILDTLVIWNDYLLPMLYLQSSKNYTLTVTLSNFQGMYFTDWSMIFSAVCLIVIPIMVIYFALQKYIVGGITAGAVKG